MAASNSSRPKAISTHTFCYTTQAYQTLTSNDLRPQQISPQLSLPKSRLLSSPSPSHFTCDLAFECSMLKSAVRGAASLRRH